MKKNLSLMNWNSYEEINRNSREYFIVEVSLPKWALWWERNPITWNVIKIGVNIALNTSILSKEHFAKTVVSDALWAANINPKWIYESKGATDLNIKTANFYIDNPMAQNPTLTY